MKQAKITETIREIVKDEVQAIKDKFGAEEAAVGAPIPVDASFFLTSRG